LHLRVSDRSELLAARAPRNSQGMQDQAIANGEAFGIEEDLIGISYGFAFLDTPGLVANNALTVLAGRVCTVSNTMTPYD
jgi:hypothetical protein